MTPATAKEPREYFSYLLRLWKVSGAGPPVWRASLEDARTGERIGFADLDILFAFLKEQIETPRSRQIDRQHLD